MGGPILLERDILGVPLEIGATIKKETLGNALSGTDKTVEELLHTYSEPRYSTLILMSQ